MEADEEAVKTELKQAIQQTQDEMTSRLSTIGPVEYAEHYDLWGQVKTFEDYCQSLDVFVKQFELYDPVFRPHYFYNDIESAITKELEVREHRHAGLHKLFEQHIQEVLRTREIITERLSTPEQIEKYSLLYNNFMSNVMNHLYSCESALLAIEQSTSPKLTSQQLEMALTTEFCDGVKNFPMKVLYHTLRMFPLVRRNEIGKLVLDRLVQDVKEAKRALPEYPMNEGELVQELVSLSDVLNVEIDFKSHDGHKFFYYCDRLFLEVYGKPLEVPEYVDVQLQDDSAELTRVLDVGLLHDIEKGELPE